MKKIMTKGIGVLFVFVSLGLITQGEFGGAIVGLLIGLAFLLLPEEQTDAILYYVGIAFGFVQAIALRLMSGFSKTVGSGTKKSTDIMNETSLRSTGHKTVKCPHCKSTNISFMDNNRKSFSVGKAVAGSALIGSTGVLAGFAGKKGKKNTWHCQECGKTFAK